MLRLQCCASTCLLLLTACGGGGGATETTEPSSSSVSFSSTATGTTTSPTSTSSTTDATTTTATSVADTETSTGTASTGGDLPDGACRETADCSGRFESCFAPGESSCGPCQSPGAPCADNDGCEPGFVCLPFDVPCACGGAGEGNCVAVCEPDSCGPGEFCNGLTGACEQFTCTDDGIVCPPHFDCVPGSGGDNCVQQTCSEDAECGGTPCVEGRCYEAFGTCMQPGA